MRAWGQVNGDRFVAAGVSNTDIRAWERLTAASGGVRP